LVIALILVATINVLIIKRDLIEDYGDFEGFLASTKFPLDFSLTVSSKPLISIMSPKTKTYSSTQILLNYSVKYADSVWYNLDNTENITLPNLTYFSINLNTTEGSHVLYLYANNSQGISVRSITFSIDLTAPTPPVAPSPPGGGGGARTITNFSLDKAKIKLSLTQGETKQEQITIKNTGNQKLKISLQNEIQDFLTVSESGLELTAGESKTIILDFLAKENTIPDLYTGKIIITGDGIEKEILVAIEIESKKPLFEVEVEIPEEFLTIMPGKEIKADIILYSLTEIEKEDVKLEYIIKNEEGEIIISEQETKKIETLTRITKTFKIPDNAKYGTHILYTKLTYKKETASASAWFSVGEEIPLKRKDIIIIIIILIIIILTGILIKLKKLKKHPKPKLKNQRKILKIYSKK